MRLLPDGWIYPLAGLLHDVSIMKQGEMEAGPLEEEGPRGMSSSLHPVLALCAVPCFLLPCFLVLPDVPAVMHESFEIMAKINLPTYIPWPSWVFCHGDNTGA